LTESKEPLFDSQFHICIENSQSLNYFTEKIIDCFVTKTIPIYFGAPNISNFFNVNGMFIANNFEDIIRICNSIDEYTYDSKIEFIDENFELAQKYITIVDRLENIIKYILNGNF